MLLASLEINNYRSLEHVELNRLQQFNVLIGRNNAGKSSVFNALYHLNSAVMLSQRGGSNNVLTARDNKRSLEVSLVFQLQVHERKEFIELLIDIGFPKERFDALLNSPLLRQISFSFKAPSGNPYTLYLRETRIQTEDGKLATIQKMAGDLQNPNPQSSIVNVGGVSNIFGRTHEPLVFSKLDIDAINQNRNHYSALSNQIKGINISPEYIVQDQQGPQRKDSVTAWLHGLLVRYFSSAFFFNPFRHSTELMPVQQMPSLSQNGANLAQVLHTINSNDRAKFREIEQFVQAALPDIGSLQTPLLGTSTEVSFRARHRNYLTRLHDMGGGIEQLLMVATVLLTTGDESTLFLEEPESHLHAGAQRFLLEKFYEGERQVFITTHAPTFINLSRPHSLYRVTYSDERTSIEHCNDKLDVILEDIGIRNSDVLLSDSVLFIEGPSDRDVLSVWSETLGKSFAESNVTLLVMGGGQHAEHGVPVRSNVLMGISQKAPIPHLFLLDRDERSQAEIDHLQKMLGDRVHILAARELENYLLIPNALLSALHSKHRNDVPILERLDQTSEEQIEQMIHDASNNLYSTVLLKRIRTELGSLRGGLLPREVLPGLIPYAESDDLAKRLLEKVDAQIDQYRSKIGEVVHTERKALETKWIDPANRLFLAPGEEVIAAVFKQFGSQYRKTSDAVRIARAMSKNEIALEIQAVITKIIALARPQK